MAICTFFGHSDSPDNIYDDVKNTIIRLIENNNVTEFIVGNQGNFDRIVLRVLNSIRCNFPQIKFTVMLAYYPKEYIENSVFPEELETVPKRYCIDRRNRIMLSKADYVISYVKHNVGGAAKYTVLAEKQNKNVIRI